MSQRNGDRSRFQINRKRRLRHRQRIRALLNAVSDRDAVASPDQQRPGAKVTKHDVSRPAALPTGVPAK
jgi:hypothetical protein